MSERALSEREREREWYPYNILNLYLCDRSDKALAFLYKKLLKLNIIGCVSSSSYIRSVVCLYSLMPLTTTISLLSI